MKNPPRYGWVSYYFNLLLLIFMSHQRRMKFIRWKARLAEASPDPAARLRALLHCTDWPIDLVQAAPGGADASEKRREMEEIRREMVERYQNARLARDAPAASQLNLKAMEALMKNNKKRTLMALVGLGLLLIVTSSGCVVLDVQTQDMEGTVVKKPDRDGGTEDDFAIKYTARVRNKGFAGKVKVMVKLTTPNGQFYREQVLRMESEEVRTLEFIFDEPIFIEELLSEGKIQAELSYETVR